MRGKLAFIVVLLLLSAVLVGCVGIDKKGGDNVEDTSETDCHEDPWVNYVPSDVEPEDPGPF